MNDIPQRLSPHEREIGQKRLYRFTDWNGLSTACLLQSVLILYGIRNGMSNPAVALLASSVHLTIPFMILGKRLVARMGLARTWSFGWRARSVAALLLVLAPFFSHAGLPPASVSAAILAGAMGFGVFRAIGIVAQSPLLGEITTERDQGRVISANWFRFNVVNMFASACVILVLRYNNSLWMFQMILLAGCFSGFYSSRIISRVPETNSPRESARDPVLKHLKLLFRGENYRWLLLAWSAAVVSAALVIPFATVMLKKGYGMADHSALIYYLILMAGGILASLVIRGISDQTGPRPLMMLTAGALAAVSIFLSFAPQEVMPLAFGAAFFIMGICQTGLIVGAFHYFLAVTPDRERVGIGLLMQIFTGAAAGLAGSAVGGGLLWLFEQITDGGLDLYRGFFRVVSLIVIVSVVVVTRMPRLKEWKVRSVLGLFFSLREIRAVFALNRIEMAPDYDAELADLERLRHIGSPISEETILKYLDSPLLAVRGTALNALREMSVGERAVQALLHEVQRGEFTTAWVAAELLGKRRVKRAAPFLRENLHSKDFFLRGKCMVALAELEDEASYDEIRRQFMDAWNPRIVIHGANALALFRRIEDLEALVTKALRYPYHQAVSEEVFQSAADLAGCGSALYEMMKEYGHDPVSACDMVARNLGSGGADIPISELRLLSEDALLSQDRFQGFVKYAAALSTKKGKLLARSLRGCSNVKVNRKSALCLAVLLRHASQS